MTDTDAAQQMILWIREIPRGRVATYGQIAALGGYPRNARQVGTVLRSLPEESNVPWHRVVNAQGRVSDRGNSAREGLQRFLLKNESVEFNGTGRVDLEEFQWRPQ